MAKKKPLEATEFDNFDDGLDFNFEDFDFDEREPPDDRHPAIKAASVVGGSAKRYASEKGNIERFVKASLPRGYGQVYEMGDQTVGELKALYNSAKEELAPVKQTAQKVIGGALPTIGSHLPKSLREKLEEFSKQDESSSVSREANREERLAGLLSEVFGQQQEARAKENESYIQRENLRQGFEQVRHKDSMGQLNAIRKAVEAQSRYNNTIGFNYQKKSLELNYRTFWAIAELVKEQKEANAKVITELKQTAKNTALPDHVKLTNSEAMGQILRNKFLDSAREKMFGGTINYLQRMSTNLQKQLKTSLASMGSIAGSAESAVGMLGQDGMMSDKDRKELIFDMLLSMPMDYLSEKGSGLINKITSKNRRIRRGDAHLRSTVSTAGDQFYDLLSDPNKTWGPLEGLREFLRNTASAGGVETQIERDSVVRMHEPHPWTRQSHKSINEIIPGLLAHIHREIRILRTGNENTELIAYDFTKNKFSTTKKIADGFKKNIGSNSERFNQGIEELVNKVDLGKKLTPQQRELLKQKLGERAVSGKSMSLNQINSSYDWGGGADGEAIAAMFRRYLRATPDGKLGAAANAAQRQIGLIEGFENITSALPDPRADMQYIANIGQLDILREAGLLDGTDSVSRDAILKIVRSGGAEETPTGRSLPSRRKLGQGIPNRFVSAPATAPGSFNTVGEFGKIAKSSAETVEELQKLREAIIKQTGDPCACLNDSELTKIVRSIDENIAKLLETNLYAGNAQLELIAGISSHMGVDPNKMSNLDMATKGLTGLAKGFAGSVYNTGKGVYDRLLKPAAHVTRATVSNMISFAKNRAINTFNKVSGILGDVYVNGEFAPRIKKTLMEAGAYYDRTTNKVIKSLEDVKGDIVDASGNVVMTFEEFKKAYVGGRWKKPVKDLLGGILKSVINTKDRIQGLVTNFIPSTIRSGYELAKKASNFALSMSPPYDVYVKGDLETPVLYANMMRYGQYFSAETKLPIRHPRQIDGPVVDKDGNYVLNIDQIKLGLVDRQGRPIRLRLITRIAGFGIRTVTNTINRIKQLGATTYGALAAAMSKFGGFFRDLFTPMALFEVTAKKTNEWLEKIHDLLDERMPGKKVFGDTDGDGIRDGSIEDILRKKERAKAAKEEDRRAEREGKSEKSMLSRLLGGIAGLIPSRSKKGNEDEDDDDDGFGLSDAADVADIYDAASDGLDRRKRKRAARKRLKRMRGAKAARVPKTPGLLNRTAARAGTAARALGRGFFSTAILRGAATAATTAGSLGAGALSAMAPAAGAIGSGAAAAAGLALKAAGALISLPGALAVGAVVGGYLLYRYSRKTKPTNLSNLRLVQYGVSPDDKAGAEKIWELEQLLAKAIVFDGDKVGFDRSKIDQTEIAKLMQLGAGDAQIFNEYLNNRFFPVFSHWMKVLRSFGESTDISNIEKIIPKKEKFKIAQTAVQSCMQVYALRAGWATNHPRLSQGHSEVVAFLESIRIPLLKEGEADGGEKATVLEKTAATTALTSAQEQAKAAMINQDSYKVTDKNGNEVDVNTLKHERLTEMIRTGEVSVQIKLNVPKALTHNRANGQLDALTTVRFKAYGLREMTMTKVQMLGALERYIADNLQGDPKSPTVGIKFEKVLNDVAEVFGIADSDERHKNRFRYWFNGRFLPVFKLYAGTVRSRNNKKDLEEGARLMSLNEQLALARAIVAATGPSPGGGTFSIWKIPSNPWKEDYELNDNPDTTASNIEAIRLLADKVALGETSARVAANTEEDQTKAATGFYKKPLVKRDSKTGYNLGIQASGDKLVGDKMLVTDKSGSVTKQDFTSPGRGLTFGSTKAGAYATLPDVTGPGWGGTKATIIAAAKAAGIDAQTLAMIIAQESSFDPNATPRGYPMPSSAKGLGQHLPGSWAEDMKFHARELGIPADASPFDPKAAALLTAMRAKRNGTRLEKLLGRPVTAGEVYMAHLMGADGAKSVLEMGGGALSMNSEKGSSAKKQHPEYFIDPRTGKPRTVAETVAYVNNKLQAKLSEFNVNPADFKGSEMQQDNNPALAAAMSTTIPAPAQETETARKANGLLPTNRPQTVLARQAAAAGGAVPGGLYAASATNLKVPSTIDYSKKADDTPRNPIPDTAGGVTLRLVREESHDDGTFGVLSLPNGSTFMTLELPWRDNKPQISCIPPGTYKAKRRQTTRFGFAFEILNVKGRSGILIHGGTYAGSTDKEQKANSQGCILLGTRRGHNGRQKMITGYKEAMSAFYDAMGNHTQCTIEITGPTNLSGANGASEQATVDLDKIRAETPGATPGTAATQPSPVVPQSTPAAPSPEPQPLPRLSRPSVSLDPRVAQTPQSMRERDKALTEVIAPKVDAINSTLNLQLDELRKVVSLLEIQAKKSPGQTTSEGQKVTRPNTTGAAAVPLRRSI